MNTKPRKVTLREILREIAKDENIEAGTRVRAEEELGKTYTKRPKKVGK